MRKTVCALLAIVASALVLPAHAQQFNYNYVDLGLRTGELLDFDATGFGAEASQAIAPNIRLKGAAEFLDIDDVDTEALNVAVQVGYFAKVAPNMDLVVDGGLLYMDIDDVDDDTGLKLDGILRLRVDPRLEVNAGLTYVDIFNDSDMGIHLAGLYSLNRDMALLARYEDFGDTSLWTFGLRLNY